METVTTSPETQEILSLLKRFFDLENDVVKVIDEKHAGQSGDVFQKSLPFYDVMFDALMESIRGNLSFSNGERI